MEDIKEPEPKPLLEQVKELQERLNDKEKTKVKKWRLPWRARVGKKKVRKGWVGVIQLNENTGLELYKVKVDEGVFESKDKIPHIGTPEYIWHYKKLPVIVVPSWDTKPLSAQELKTKTIDKKSSAHGYKLLANHLLKGQLQLDKKKMGLAPLIIIAILAGIGYFMYKSGAFS